MALSAKLHSCRAAGCLLPAHRAPVCFQGWVTSPQPPRQRPGGLGGPGRPPKYSQNLAPLWGAPSTLPFSHSSPCARWRNAFQPLSLFALLSFCPSAFLPSSPPILPPLSFPSSYPPSFPPSYLPTFRPFYLPTFRLAYLPALQFSCPSCRRSFCPSSPPPTVLQGYLAQKKTPSPRTLPLAYA